MSFPAATVYLSNSIERAHQGVAASLVNTVVNYSISLGLGFAGTVEVNVSNGDSPEDILKGYRGALYIAVGFAGLALATSILFLCHTYWIGDRGKASDGVEGGGIEGDSAEESVAEADLSTKEADAAMGGVR